MPLEVLLAEAALQLREPGGAVILQASWLGSLSSAGHGWWLSHQGQRLGNNGPSATGRDMGTVPPLTQQNIKINGARKRLETFQVEEGLKVQKLFIRKHHQ